jgi:Ni,Fe-hydrogenase maturation factor
MQYLLCFGNPYLSEDNLALEVGDAIIKDKIKGLEVIKCVAPDEVMSYIGKDFFILDVVKGMKKVMLISDIDRLQSGDLVSLHDFDLGFFLKLMKETGKIKDVKIIGIPQKGNLKDIKKEVIAMITRSAKA